MIPPDRAVDITQGFAGKVLGPVPLSDAVDRILAYCTEPLSGWGTYDLAAMHARESGLFDELTSWSLFLANALNGQVTLGNVASFDLRLRTTYAGRLARVPVSIDLSAMTDGDLKAVVDACAFGFPGVWGPKITKLGALYRPRAIPVLDGHVAEAFGFSREAFSSATPTPSGNRRERIRRVVEAMAKYLGDNQPTIEHIRGQVTAAVPEIAEIPDLRLLDIVIWTSQDDKIKSGAKPGVRWIERKPRARMTKEDLVAVAVPGSAGHVVA